MMRIWRNQFIRVAGSFPDIVVDYYYITGDNAVADDYALDSCERIEAKATQQTNGECTVHRIGAAELLQQIRMRPRKSRQIEWATAPMLTNDGAVGLVSLPKFCKFLEDEPGVLAERIFESNVRGYLKKTTVNEQIAKSLGKSEPNFWLLNNGVTVIASKANPSGPMAMTVEDPQVVNGLQTSREIFAYFKTHKDQPDERSVLVRVIPTEDQTISDEIIAATNNQNQMPAASLRMTDHIHRDIEQIFKRVDLFYDRRKGFYRDQGKPIRKIISVNAVAQAVISILLQRPDDARARPGDYFKDDEQYKLVFDNSKIPVGAYLTCVQIVQKVDEFLENSDVGAADRKNLKFYVAALAVRAVTGTATPPASRLNVNAVTEDIIRSSYTTVNKYYLRPSESADRDAIARGPLLLKRVDESWRRAHRRNARASNVRRAAAR